MTRRKGIAVLYGLTAFGAIIWTAAALAAPCLRSEGSPASGFLYSCFAPVCHQIPQRSFRVCGYPMAVCARCFGVYAGFLLGLALYPFARGFRNVRLPKKTTFLILAAPIGLDAAANVLGLWSTPGLIRFETGLLWGTILPFYFLTGLADLALRLFRRPPVKKSSAS
jgi:uncharacterized membrane protein